MIVHYIYIYLENRYYWILLLQISHFLQDNKLLSIYFNCNTLYCFHRCIPFSFFFSFYLVGRILWQWSIRKYVHTYVLMKHRICDRAFNKIAQTGVLSILANSSTEWIPNWSFELNRPDDSSHLPGCFNAGAYNFVVGKTWRRRD